MVSLRRKILFYHLNKDKLLPEFHIILFSVLFV